MYVISYFVQTKVTALFSALYNVYYILMLDLNITKIMLANLRDLVLLISLF